MWFSLNVFVCLCARGGVGRIDVWWRTKNPDAFLQGCKIDLQNMIGSKLPAALLKLVYRFSFRRKVICPIPLSSHLHHPLHF